MPARSVNTSHAWSIGTLTVNSLSIFMFSLSSTCGRGSSGRRLFEAEGIEFTSHRVPIVGGLGDRPQSEHNVDPCQLGRAEYGQRGDPVDGLGHARSLVEVEVTNAPDEVGGREDQ